MPYHVMNIVTDWSGKLVAIIFTANSDNLASLDTYTHMLPKQNLTNIPTQFYLLKYNSHNMDVASWQHISKGALIHLKS